MTLAQRGQCGERMRYDRGKRVFLEGRSQLIHEYPTEMRKKNRAKKGHEPLVYEQLSLDGFRVARGYSTTREVSELYGVSPSTVNPAILA
jgi:hypothetical protein